MNGLSTEEVLLLNNLMYLVDDPPLKDMLSCQDGETVGDFVGKILNNGAFDSKRNYTMYTDGTEWKNIIESVSSDEKLCNVEIIAKHIDENGGMAVLFNNVVDNEAVVVYRGTNSPYEWKDNFQGGSVTNQPDGVSTGQQECALEWFKSLELDNYDSVTVSGHSKGGNKAKYITIMDDAGTVDRCLSFDGQGFSDEFINKYQDKIAQNQYKIHNHNVDADYVNILLNDVGDKTYYKGFNYHNGILLGSFPENHCPNTFMNFDENGNFSLTEAPQNKDLKNLDIFFNSYLRSISQEKRIILLNTFATIVVSALSSEERIAGIKEIITDKDKLIALVEMAEYYSLYTQENPEVKESFENIFEGILNGFIVDSFSVVAWLLDNTKWGKQRKRAQRRVGEKMTFANGKDLKVNDVFYKNKNENFGDNNFYVRSTGLKNVSENMLRQQNSLAQMADRIASVQYKLGLSYVDLIGINASQRQDVIHYEECCMQLGISMKKIVQNYENTEKSILNTNTQ